MFPLFDQGKKRKKFPLLTFFLIFINFLIFFISIAQLEIFIYQFGFIPKNLLEQQKFPTLFSATFLHASFFHLISNMWFLWIFGDDVEVRMGKLKFLILYFFSSIVGFIFHTILNSEKTIPVIGASGAISGILGAYLILFPKNKIVTIVPIFYFLRIVVIPAFFYILLWFLYQFFYMEINPFVAWWAHIGGFLGGIIFTIFFKRK